MIQSINSSLGHHPFRALGNTQGILGFSALLFPHVYNQKAVNYVFFAFYFLFVCLFVCFCQVEPRAKQTLIRGFVIYRIKDFGIDNKVQMHALENMV